MSRRRIQKKRFYAVDPVYQSTLVSIVANRFIQHGKKSFSYRLIYSVLQKIREKFHREPLAVLEYSIRRVTPKVQLKTRRVGGTNYQVPIKVGIGRGTKIAIQSILIATKMRPGQKAESCLLAEILDAANGTGKAIRTRDEIHRIAEANKAFARYSFLLEK
jgi:small subunit ribosomal protein S7